MTLADASHGGLDWRWVPFYVLAQLIGACVGVFLAHLMFAESVLQLSTHQRSGAAQLVSEFVATLACCP